MLAIEPLPEPTDTPPSVDETIRLTATTAALESLHDLIARFWAAIDAAPLPTIAEVQRLSFVTAIIEIGGNIIRYSYPPAAPGPIELRLLAWPDRLEARYTDAGVPYTPPAPSPPAEHPLDLSDGEELPEGGYGMQIARAALDALDYRRTDDGRNRWTLLSRIRA